jgi:hypothetical protein
LFIKSFRHSCSLSLGFRIENRKKGNKIRDKRY